jgi:hypothetical protein
MKASELIDILDGCIEIHGDQEVYMDIDENGLLEIDEADVDVDDNGIILWAGNRKEAAA